MSRTGYNPNCTMKLCSAGCCAADGNCPIPSHFNISKKYCKYYYTYSNTRTSNGISISGGGGAIAGIVIGGVVGLIAIIIGLVFCIKKCRANQAEQSIAQPQASLNITQASLDPNPYNQPYNQPYVMPANQSNGQPYMIPPTQQYGQPYVQPINQVYPQPPNPFVAAVDPIIGQPINYGNYDQGQINQPKNYGDGPIVR